MDKLLKLRNANIKVDRLQSCPYLEYNKQLHLHLALSVSVYKALAHFEFQSEDEALTVTKLYTSIMSNAQLYNVKQLHT